MRRIRKWKLCRREKELREKGVRQTERLGKRRVFNRGKRGKEHVRGAMIES